MPVLSQIPEAFLHYIWRTKNFDPSNLKTRKGEIVRIHKYGTLNRDQGPDFLFAELSIGDFKWSGNIEMHVQAREWYTHKHEQDANYNSVILHVVYESNQTSILREDGTEVPELVLKSHIDPSVFQLFDRLRLSEANIPCQNLIQTIPKIHISQWVERMAVERLEKKAQTIHHILEDHISNWEQTTWEEIAARMGGPVNKEAFRHIARQLPFHVVKKQVGDRLDLEAMIFGISGMLIGIHTVDSYVEDLQERWEFLSKKYGIGTSVHFPIRFLRMRPPNFPTIRLSQLAQIVQTFPNITDLLLPQHVETFLHTSIKSNSYWETHYRFGEETEFAVKSLGKGQKETLLINAILPISYLYHKAHGRQEQEHILIENLQKLKAENNRITRAFAHLGIQNTHALNSQGLIQLKTSYCDEKKCLHCGIGHQILKGQPSVKK